MKTVIITGASRGIGREIALKFATAGYHLGLCCKNNLARLEDTKRDCEAMGVRCVIEQTDISVNEQVEEFIHTVADQLGAPSILINNAGISHIGLLDEMTCEQWDNMISTNLSSVFYTSRAIIPYMIHEKWGRILNISSVWGNVGASCEVAYSAAKGGVNSFTKALAKELAPSNIAVNAVAFGCIDTEMNQNITKEDKAALINEIPASRFGTPHEAADLVYSVITSTDYLTGQIITMDGGWC